MQAIGDKQADATAAFGDSSERPDSSTPEG